ncbi:GNAT family protein [uncultured Bartonella sp.]|uniref:GNAT family N-acetyltransferase n=1 Tax=uncultured Bartonella sp. TaxID=104108 RepID=UPI0026037EBC|nr:GNAT family protein [uncultured Bartonella sp.]
MLLRVPPVLHFISIHWKKQKNLSQPIASRPHAKAYVIEYKETGKPVGIISLIQIDYKNRSAQCIIDIGDKTVWGKGIGTASLSLLLSSVFSERS